MKWLDKLDDAILAYSQKILIARAQDEEKSRYDRIYSPQTSNKISVMGTGALSTTIQKASGPRADFNKENKSFDFTLHPAETGWILELSHYDERNDRYIQRLHIINSSEDMGESISKILTVELLRR